MATQCALSKITIQSQYNHTSRSAECKYTYNIHIHHHCAFAYCYRATAHCINRIILQATFSVNRNAAQDSCQIIVLQCLSVSHSPLGCDRVDFMLNNAIHVNAELQKPLSVKWKVKCCCAAGSCVITRLNAAPSLSVVLNLQPVPEVCCSPRRPMKEYRLFVIGSVTTECTQQQMRNRKKMLWGLKCHVNSWVQPLNTSGVLSTPFNAFKGQGFV